VLPLLLCKKLYNDKKAENDDQKYLNIIVDEAHNILSEDSERERTMEGLSVGNVRGDH
jgi:uncharacterized protein